MSSNPLLETPTLRHGAIPFGAIQNDHFNPAFDSALAEARGNLAKIKGDSSAPTFESVIVALESSSEKLDSVSAIFSNLLHAHTNEELQKLAQTIMPKLAEFSNDVHLDPELFKRVKAVWDSRAGLKLDAEQSQLLEKTYKAFARNGALLDEKAKLELRRIDARLSVLSQQYGDQLLKSTNAFELHVTDSKDLAGLPQSAIEAAKLAAKEKNRDGWVFTLDYPSIGPFMKFAENRALREKMWRAQTSVATSGDTDNRPVLLEIAKLRHERARLLGYETHAHFVLEERMAAKPETVRKFLDELLDISRAAAEKDLAEVQRLAGHELQPWDFAFWSEKLKKEKYSFDEELVRPYFKLENVVDGVFEHARRLYGVTFKKVSDLPVYHPDVQVFEVADEASGEFVGLFYADFFPRPSKQNGAWMTSFRDQGLLGGKLVRPHVSIVCNLTKPTETKPSLLNLNEVRTVFHEFGHSLHLLLSKCRYRSLAGTNVYWDFVELPSQIMENWVKEKESLDLFARHYGSGEKIPAEFVEKIERVSRFQAGWMSLRQLNFGYLDLAWHAGDPSTKVKGPGDVEAYETEATRRTTLFAHQPGAMLSPGFGHIFAGGYSAGYYSYKWAEVLDADAFELFKEKGIFNSEVARKFKENILSRGGSEHPMTLYKRFRGREPDPKALLRRTGLLEDRAVSGGAT